MFDHDYVIYVSGSKWLDESVTKYATTQLNQTANVYLQTHSANVHLQTHAADTFSKCLPTDTFSKYIFTDTSANVFLPTYSAYMNDGWGGVLILVISNHGFGISSFGCWILHETGCISILTCNCFSQIIEKKIMYNVNNFFLNKLMWKTICLCFL